MVAVPRGLSVLEICAGAGGQSLGLEMAGFDHAAAVEIDPHACATLRHNRPSWHVLQEDVREFSAKSYRGIDLFAGGVPCPPFSIAGKQLGRDDERDLFPEALRIVGETRPSAVLLENVKGFAQAKFEPYRRALLEQFDELGYRATWRVLNACDFGVPQLRPRFLLVAMRPKFWRHFSWPAERQAPTGTVGEALLDLMEADGWPGAAAWAARAAEIAPTLVGGSKKHGGPDLGPTRARAAWLELGVDGLGLADRIPGRDTPKQHVPKLTIPMIARLQGFPDAWKFVGSKTHAYRQVGNAFPPPVAKAVGMRIGVALKAAKAAAPESAAPAAAVAT
jgi:DNA (cytosine-5)-methyltransferase 1